MSMQVTELKNTFSAAFESLQSGVSNRLPLWVEDLRLRALEHFEAVGFPTTDDEDYKYTNVAPIARGNFQPAAASDASGIIDPAHLEQFIYEEADGRRLVFINGFYDAELSSLDALPAGVIAGNLADALNGDAGTMLKNFLARGAETSGDDAFTALNTAFLASGAFVYVPRNVRVEAPIHLLFVTESAGEAIATFPRVLVIAEPHSEATIIEDHTALVEQASYFSSPVIEIYVDDEARVAHYKVQRESIDALHVARTRVEVGRAGIYDSTTINLGSALARHNINLQLRGEGSETWIDGLFFGEGTQHMDTHSLINHLEPHCTSHQAYKGILNDRARSVFNGRIFVHPGAQKTDAYQSNKNLLLSNEARVDTKPQLEIFADDVKCSHGATVGQLNEEELFYLISRGIHPELARNLLTYGFAEAIVEKIKVASIKRQLDEAILNRLHASLEA
ncbi:MAG: Fe-S cluster assembly protein SufD [Pyrinomonadaceae bacterium]|nr:Fe-S cluster assembly protein SufD [Pyrinomonadaceae bacterium]